MKIRVSSSIANFREKLVDRMGMEEWTWRDQKEDVMFFGMYHIGDYVRLDWAKGRRIVFWTGGDIINLGKTTVWKYLIKNIDAEHVCENDVEKIELAKYGIDAEVKPAMFDNPDNFQISYNQSNNPHVYINAHPEYEEQYGVNVIEGIASVVPDVTFHIYGVEGSTRGNIVYHGTVPTEQFDNELHGYHAGLRLNDFDGFGEVLAKSLLLGQWPISRISYPYIDHAKDTTDLINLLRDLKNKKKPNFEGEKYWRKQLSRKPGL